MSIEESATAANGIPRAPKADRADHGALIAISCVGVVLFLCILACTPTNFGILFKPYSIPSGSMIPTLKVGSYAIASRAAYGFSRYSFDWVRLPIEGRLFMTAPQRGDIVTFKLPRDVSLDYVKRIVGLPGDTVQMIKGRLLINGQMIAREPVAKTKIEDFYGKMVEVPTYRESLREGESHMIIEVQGDTGFNDDTAVFEVPLGQYFVMGDNRDNSTDSRVLPEHGGVGFVPLENLVGRIVFNF